MEDDEFDEGSFFRAVPCLDDLEATKRFAGRPKDAEDLRLLQALRRRRGEG